MVPISCLEFGISHAYVRLPFLICFNRRLINYRPGQTFIAQGTLFFFSAAAGFLLLRCFIWPLSVNSFLLCASTMFLIFGMQLYDIFTVFLLNIGRRTCPLGKHSSTVRRNCFPTLVFTRISKGGLYQVIFLFLDLFRFGGPFCCRPWL